MWQASSLPLLFASRVPGLLLHCMLCSQAAIATLSAKESRAAALGRLSLSYGLGMVPGSLLGGALADSLGHHVAALAAALVTGTIIIADAVFLPSLGPPAGVSDSNKLDPDTSDVGLGDGRDGAGDSGDSTGGWRHVASTPAVVHLLLFSVMAGLGLSVFQSMLSLGINDRFGVEASGLGFYMSFVALVGLITNTLLV